MSKRESLKLYPNARCQKWKNGRFYILNDNINPVFPHGHKSSTKAWKELFKIYEAI